jgi:hypothetical protein
MSLFEPSEGSQMNDKTLQFIEDNWKLLLKPEIKGFQNLVTISPLYSVLKIIRVLSTGSQSVEAIAIKTDLHPNSVKSITRVLDGVLFNREPQGKTKGKSLLISLSVEAIEIISKQKVQPEIKQAGNLPDLNSIQKQGHFIVSLPEKKHYRTLESNSEKYLFEDKGTPGVRIISPIPNPWREDKWKIWPAMSNDR